MKIRLKEEAVFKVDDNGNIIVINVMDEDDFYYRIYGIACEVFTMLNSGLSFTDVSAKIAKDYEISKDTVNSDIESLVADLKDYGLIEVI